MSIPRVNIGFWPTPERGVVLGAVRVCDGDADVTVTDLLEIDEGQSDRSRARSEGSKIWPDGWSVNPDALSQDQDTGSAGIAILRASSPLQATAALSTLANQANTMLASSGAPFFPALCSVIGLLTNAQDSSTPCLVAAALCESCSVYASSENSPVALSWLIQAVNIAQQSGVSAEDATKAILEGIVRCALAIGEGVVPARMVSFTADALKRMINPMIVDAVVAQAKSKVPNRAPTSFDSLASGAPILPFLPARLVQAQKLLVSSTEAALSSVLSSLASMWEAVALANTVRSDLVSPFLDVLAGRKDTTGKPSARPPLADVFAGALLERASREMLPSYSAGTIRDVVCHVAALVQGDEDALRAWARAISPATARAIVNGAMLDSIECSGYGEYQLAVVKTALEQIADGVSVAGAPRRARPGLIERAKRIVLRIFGRKA